MQLIYAQNLMWKSIDVQLISTQTPLLKTSLAIHPIDFRLLWIVHNNCHFVCHFINVYNNYTNKQTIIAKLLGFRKFEMEGGGIIPLVCVRLLQVWSQ